MPESKSLPDWAYVEKPCSRGVIKVEPRDFFVEEMLGFELSGAGEHLYLLIEKWGLNTQELVKVLSRQLSIHPRHISYAGLKDKQAVTRQWISLLIPGDIELVDFQSNAADLSGFRVLEAQRHSSKLKRGAHQGNHFEIVVRDISENETLEAAIERIRAQGVPNYFGEQRFGRGGKNIDKARALFSGKQKVDRQLRGLYLSAARSFLFNEVLSERVHQEAWASILPGEVLMLDGSNSFFKSDALDTKLSERLDVFDIHPSAPLWGKGNLASSADAFRLESEIIVQYPDLSCGLEAFGLRQQRRATRLIPTGLTCTWTEQTSLKIGFELSKGNFATTVLRELFTIGA